MKLNCLWGPFCTKICNLMCHNTCTKRARESGILERAWGSHVPPFKHSTHRPSLLLSLSLLKTECICSNLSKLNSPYYVRLCESGSYSRKMLPTNKEMVLIFVTIFCRSTFPGTGKGRMHGAKSLGTWIWRILSNSTFSELMNGLIWTIRGEWLGYILGFSQGVFSSLCSQNGLFLSPFPLPQPSFICCLQVYIRILFVTESVSHHSLGGRDRIHMVVRGSREESERR